MSAPSGPTPTEGDATADDDWATGRRPLPTRPARAAAGLVLFLLMAVGLSGCNFVVRAVLAPGSTSALPARALSRP